MENQNKELSAVVIQPDGSAAAPEGGPNQIHPYESSTTLNQRRGILFRLKLITVLLGTIVLGVGGHAYFYSPMNNTAAAHTDHNSEAVFMAFESFFISVVIISYGVSISNLIFTFDADYKSGNNKREMIFHILAGIFLFLAGFSNILSAEAKLVQLVIKFRLYDTDAAKAFENLPPGSLGVNGNKKEDGYILLRNGYQLFDGKIAAGSLALVNACLYCHTARYIRKLAN